MSNETTDIDIQYDLKRIMKEAFLDAMNQCIYDNEFRPAYGQDSLHKITSDILYEMVQMKWQLETVNNNIESLIHVIREVNSNKEYNK